jgi:hypothetical protein
MASQQIQNQIFNYLVGKDLDPEIQKIPDPADPDGKPNILFTFDYLAPSGKNYGTVVILIGEQLEMYFGDSLGRTMEGRDKDSWYEFLLSLRNIARRNMMSYQWKDLNKLKHSLRGQAQLTEAVMESLSGNRTRSWTAPPDSTRLVIHHSRPINEGDARYRAIDKIFIETADGERYKLPFRSLRGAKAMLEHVRQGGRPYDVRGSHICEMVNELSILSKFKRAHNGKIFEADVQSIIDRTNNYFIETRNCLNHIGTAKGYTKYFESWQPMESTGDEMMVEDLRNMFIETRLDQRIESALPLLARIGRQPMKEADEFEHWTATIVEGTWALPDTEVEKEKLAELLANPMPVGVEALNATEQLYDIFGDDQLFDKLTALAEEDPEADARPLILARMAELDSAFHLDDYMQGAAEEPEPEPESEPVPPPTEPVPPAAPTPPPAAGAPLDQFGQPVPPQQPQQPVQEGAVKQLNMDLNELNDIEFFEKYRKTKAQVRDKIGSTFTKRNDKHQEEMAKLKSLLSRLNA